MMSNTNIIQWNCQGIRGKKDELLELAKLYKPSVIAIQETKLWVNSDFRFPNYIMHRQDGHYNRTPHGGVALLIHQSFPYQELPIQTPYQAVAIRIQFHVLVSICCIYLPRSTRIEETSLLHLINQLPSPRIIMGDFNSNNTLWGSNTIDARGRTIEEVARQMQLNIINDGTPTRVTLESETCIDLTLASPSLAPLLQWSVAASSYDSDHNPLLVSLAGVEREGEAYKKLNIKLADWGSFAASTVWTDIPEDHSDDPLQQLEDFYQRIKEASTISIPEFTINKFYPKPFWSPELKTSRLKRENLYNKFRRNKSNRNMINWKKARAEHRKLLKKHKQKQWRELASTFNKNTPLNKIYENIRKIKGREPRTIHILTDEGRIFSKIPEIVNKLAQTFSKISNSDNYSTRFKQHKRIVEATPFDFTSDNTESYNSIITINELENAIRSTRNTAPGPDQVFYQMLKALPDHAKAYLLSIFNGLFKKSIFPDQWRQATVIALPKPGKDHSNPTNFRPIALTSCLSKTLERILNKRLCDYLIMHKKISPIQCGSKKNHSTNEHLLRLETTIRNANAHQEHVITIFFDLHKAYDTTWNFGIMKDLHNMGLRGRLPLIIKQFLSRRSFRVAIGQCLSDDYPQEEGVPQGSVLSVTLFAIKINDLANILPRDPRLLSSLYVDDFQLSFRHTSLVEIGNKLQQCLNSINEWSMREGFTFSLAKTAAVHFTKIPGLHNPPDLFLYDQRIEYKNTFKFLGMLWDNKLTWAPHINQLKANTTKVVGMLKSISAQDWGGDKLILRHLYRIFIRSKLDYGSMIYHSAAKTTTNILEPVVNDCLRMITGCFKSTPVESLKIIANEPPLSIRRDLLSLKYFLKIKSQLSSPAHSAISDHSRRLLFQNKNLTPSFAIRTHQLLTTFNIDINFICPEFSYTLLNITTPTWKTRSITTNDELCCYPKATTSNIMYRQLFAELTNKFYRNWSKLYTDGSKTEHGVGAAAVSEEETKTATLPPIASIFSAELHAITIALNIIEKYQNIRNAVIFTDSLSTLSSLTDKDTNHPTSRRIQHRLHELLEGRKIELCWIPGHAGIIGNEAADLAAKNATTRHCDGIPLPYTDWFPLIKTKMHQKWTEQWQAKREKLKTIKETPGHWKRLPCSRREEVIINRLRSGHTWLTHNYLMSNFPEPPPTCPLCNTELLTVNHLLLDCPQLNQARETHLGIRNNGPPIELKKLLGEDIKVNNIMNYLKAINAYDKI